jgi:hypothetical protein
MSDLGETFASPTTTPDDGASRPAQVADAASSGAAETAATARDGAKDVAGEAVTQVKAVAGEARQQVSTLVDQTKGELSKQADARTTQAAGGLRTLAGQVDALANGRPDESGPWASLLGDAHGRMSTLAERLESGGSRQLAADVSDFARRRPIVFLAAAVGAGFVAGRLARAGRPAVQDSDQGSPALTSTTPSMTASVPGVPSTTIGSRPATFAAPLDAPGAPPAAPPVIAQVP